MVWPPCPTVLEEAEALELLRTALNIRRTDTRVRDEPQAALDIVRLCGLLPLALEIIAAGLPLLTQVAAENPAITKAWADSAYRTKVI
ncbi:hypothetical protein, partial [Nonomuraea sp. NPDC046570]|uniref:hypothetical protein n=1 Tax=Nonomuraea sp. NPDC046570 TaxID=3155255 RepID=UPI0033DFC66E